jgi:hypothetical protein
MSVFPGMRQFWPGRFQGPHPVLLLWKHFRSLTMFRLIATLLVETQYHASGKEIRCISWQPKFHFRVHRSPGSSAEQLIDNPYSHTAFLYRRLFLLVHVDCTSVSFPSRICTEMLHVYLICL